MIIELCKDKGRKLSDEDDYRVTVDGVVMSIVTWNKVIDELRRVAAAEAIESKSDIDQLAGFCSMMDSTAFIPFSPEDMGSIVARKEERNYQVIDKLFDKVCANKSLHANAKSLRAAAWRGGYTRYVRIEGYNLALIYNRNAWMDNSLDDTPFWFYFADDGWKQSEELRNKLRIIPESQKTLIDIDNKICIALYPLFHATLDEVVDDLMKQILDRIK